jgi:hypothetical protein
MSALPFTKKPPSFFHEMNKTMVLKTGKPWYKEPWPWILMAGPAVVIVAGLVTLGLAIRSNDGLVTDDYYKQGLAVNQTMHRDQQAGALGIVGELMRSDENLRLVLTANAGTVLPKELTFKLAHPTRAGLDQVVRMNAEGGGMYGGKLAASVSGRWHVIVEDGAGQWRLVGDWQADAVEPLRLTALADK